MKKILFLYIIFSLYHFSIKQFIIDPNHPIVQNAFGAFAAVLAFFLFFALVSFIWSRIRKGIFLKIWYKLILITFIPLSFFTLTGSLFEKNENKVLNDSIPIGFSLISLNNDITFELPSNWTVNKYAVNTDGAKYVKAFDLASFYKSHSILILTAECKDSLGNIIGIANVRYYPELMVDQYNSSKFTYKEIHLIDSIVKANISKELSELNLIPEWFGTARTTINSKIAFISKYNRPSFFGGGPFKVNLVRFFNKQDSFTFTISYDNNYSNLLEDITEHSIMSIKIK